MEGPAPKSDWITRSPGFVPSIIKIGWPTSLLLDLWWNGKKPSEEVKEKTGWTLLLNLTVSAFPTAARLKGLIHPAIVLYSFWDEIAVLSSGLWRKSITITP
jgi:hypothetical protein